jgi:hypothetical protein
LGLVTPLGNDVASSWSAIKEGRSGINALSQFDTTEFTTRFGGSIKNFDCTLYLSAKDARRMDVFIQYGLAAGVQAHERRASKAFPRDALLRQGYDTLAGQLALVRRWRMPELLVRMMDDSYADNPRVRNVMLAVNIARHSMHGWDNAALPDDFTAAAQLLSTTPEKVADLIRPEEAHAA